MDVIQNVKKFYSDKVTSDLKTNVSTSCSTKIEKIVCQALGSVHADITNRYFGCGITVPQALRNLTVLDLGSGSGRDCFAVSKLVGENGNVIGVDMTEELLEFSKSYLQYHREAYGYGKSNIKFVLGYLEDLNGAGIANDSVDIVISNCVIDLCKDKHKVLSEAYKVLKPGGEMCFGDMYADRVISKEIRTNEKLWGEGLSGALHWEELRSLALNIGFLAPRLVSVGAIEVVNQEMKTTVAGTKYASIVYRLFKLPKVAVLEPRTVQYKGTFEGYQENFVLDTQYEFPKGNSVIVDGETAAILKYTRYASGFEFSPVSVGCALPKVVTANPFEILECSKAS